MLKQKFNVICASSLLVPHIADEYQLSLALLHLSDSAVRTGQEETRTRGLLSAQN